MRGKLPPLNALRSFEAVARHLSFTKAAGELFVTESAVSRAIKQLEEHFGAQLFERRPNGLELTAEGKLLAPTITQALDDVARAASHLYGKRPHPSLTILAAPYLALRWLVPKLPAFRRANPDVDIALVSSVETDDILSSAFDLALWWERPSAEHRCENIMKRHFVPMCSASLIEEFPVLEDATPDLSRVPLLHERDYAYWQAWFSLAGWNDVTAPHGHIYSNYETLLAATHQGMGLGLILDPHDMDRRAADGLMTPFGTDVTVEVEYNLLYLESALDDPTSRSFIEFVRGHIGADTREA